MKHLRYIFLFIIILTGCSTHGVFQSENNVFVVLSADTCFGTPWESVVKIGKSLGVGDTVPVGPNWDFPWNGVDDAVVSLSSTEGQHQLSPIPGETGYYDIESIQFLPGQEWELDVEYPDGEHVTGATVIPGDFEIINPLNDTITDLEILEWSSSINAKGYGVWIMGWVFSDYDDKTHHYEYYDYCYNDSIWLYDRNPWIIHADSMYVHISALDTNLFNYWLIWGAYPLIPKNVDNQFDNAKGVFGAMKTVSRFYYVDVTDTVIVDPP